MQPVSVAALTTTTHCDPSYILHLAKSNGRFSILRLTNLSTTWQQLSSPSFLRHSVFWTLHSSGFPPTSPATLRLLHTLICLLSVRVSQGTSVHQQALSSTSITTETLHPLDCNTAAVAKCQLASTCFFPPPLLSPLLSDFLSLM